ncbi:UNVERIFIED_CONTAM: hypothetical protein Slati_0167300 [Sesamum latifolium]|uniref:Uncharacterized protein n=1 Tax=Sesamum latifolium TaxID=2727402 RepID=A0AAW2YAH1_9LAMI
MWGLGHIFASCELRFEERFQDPGEETPYGAWLRAPPGSWGSYKPWKVPDSPPARRHSNSYTARGPEFASSDGLGSHVPETGFLLENDITIGVEDTANFDLGVAASGLALDEGTHSASGPWTTEREEQLISVPVSFVVGTRGLTARRGRGLRRLPRLGSVVRKRGRDPVVVEPAPPLAMKLLVWNYQGWAPLGQFEYLMSLFSSITPHLSSSPGTKCKKLKCEIFKEKFNLFGVNVDSQVKGRCLMLLWRKDINLVVHSFSTSHIDACDFNEILNPDEKTGALRPDRQIEDFKTYLLDCQLVDLGYSGAKCTWCNQREAPHIVRVHLDRACAMLGWQAMFPQIPVECEELVRTLWNNKAEGTATSRILQRHNTIRDGLIGWDKLIFGHVCRRVKELEDQLASLDNDPITAKDQLLRGRLRNELDKFLSRKELMWKQTGKAQWLSEGERNTPFFHAKVSARRRKNSISCLRNKSNPSEEAIVGVLGGMATRVSDDMNEALTQPFSCEEKLLAISLLRQNPRASCEKRPCVMWGWVLKEFEAASGMILNLDKSKVALSRNISEQLQVAPAQILGFCVVEKHVKYLGLPALVRRSKKELFQSLKDRIWKRL